MDLIQYDHSNVLIEEAGLSPVDYEQLAGNLDAVRVETLADVDLWKSGNEIPAEKQPLDAGFIDLPDRILAEYKEQRDTSELGTILATARRIAAECDRVVVLGIGGSYMGARALMEACCHPYYNELSRGERAGWPRIYYEGNNADNDATQGLLDIIARRGTPRSVDDRWAICVISKSGGTLETAAAFRVFLKSLEESCGGEREKVAPWVVPVTGPSGKLRDLAGAIGCPDVFTIPDGVGGRFSVFSAVGLLPAALMGLDVVKLLEGAAAMNQHFHSAPIGENVVLDYVATCHLLEKKRGLNIRVLSTWGKALEAAGLWYDQLLSESLGKDLKGATPITGVNTRDLHSRGQQHQDGARDKLITNLYTDSVKCDRLSIGESAMNQDELNVLADKTLPDILEAAREGTNKAYADDRRPTADLRLPALDEASMGQLLQMLMLATVVEGRLVDTNPYGQPGVEGYKTNMNAILRG